MSEMETIDSYALVHDAVLRALKAGESEASIDDAINAAFDQFEQMPDPAPSDQEGKKDPVPSPPRNESAVQGQEGWTIHLREDADPHRAYYEVVIDGPEDEHGAVPCFGKPLVPADSLREVEQALDETIAMWNRASDDCADALDRERTLRAALHELRKAIYSGTMSKPASNVAADALSALESTTEEGT